MQLAYYNVDSINNNKGKKEDEDILLRLCIFLLRSKSMSFYLSNLNKVK